MARPSLSNWNACVDEVARMYASEQAPSKLADDEESVRVARQRLPAVYRRAFGDAIYRLRGDWAGADSAYYTDARQAIVQHAEADFARPLLAFQEVVADVFDGYLDAAERAHAWQPDHRIVAPIAVFGAADDGGPYHLDAYPDDRIHSGIAVLPITHREGALVGWSLLAHEVAGHGIVGARRGLSDEIAANLRRRGALRDAGLASYFAHRAEETTADILGVLNMGPAAAVGLLAYFAGWNAGRGDPRRLSRHHLAADQHPMEALRGLIAAETVRLLEFGAVDAWYETLSALARSDFGRSVEIGTRRLALSAAVDLARVVAQTIATWSLKSIGGLALNRIQNWHDDDEAIVDRLRGYLRTPAAMPQKLPNDHYATHAVAAGVLESFRAGGSLPRVFSRTVTLLERMQRANTVWGRDGS